MIAKAYWIKVPVCSRRWFRDTRCSLVTGEESGSTVRGHRPWLSREINTDGEKTLHFAENIHLRNPIFGNPAEKLKEEDICQLTANLGFCSWGHERNRQGGCSPASDLVGFET